uniref:Capsid protein n=1 Tax=Spilarctia obliqua nucleopolyhedrovirus TaxID=1638618 RepID=A0A7G9U868_9ABAC|nr:capsid protein [Spilarctia obliqua nucleopolyhedrovirus]
MTDSEASGISSESSDSWVDPDIEKADKRELKYTVNLHNFIKSSNAFKTNDDIELRNLVDTATSLLQKKPRTIENVEKANVKLNSFRERVVMPANALDSQQAPALYAKDAAQFYVAIEDLILAGKYEEARAHLKLVNAPFDAKVSELSTYANQLSANQLLASSVASGPKTFRPPHVQAGAFCAWRF